ncbi:MAG: hypothetical protein FJY43_09790 [Betaproteobacteria bacterium]|nr:hypothetical protein [Betaproteobacteria bacterium]
MKQREAEAKKQAEDAEKRRLELARLQEESTRRRAARGAGTDPDAAQCFAHSRASPGRGGEAGARAREAGRGHSVS